MRYLHIEGNSWLMTDQSIVFNSHLGDPIVIPSLFVSDGGSIPKFLWPLLGDGKDKNLKAFILHDYLYEPDFPHKLDRLFADKLMYQYLRMLGCGWLKAQTIYRGVRMFGNRFHKRDRWKPTKEQFYGI